jgi:hypothetical protein
MYSDVALLKTGCVVSRVTYSHHMPHVFLHKLLEIKVDIRIVRRVWQRLLRQYLYFCTRKANNY